MMWRWVRSICNFMANTHTQSNFTFQRIPYYFRGVQSDIANKAFRSCTIPVNSQGGNNKLSLRSDCALRILSALIYIEWKELGKQKWREIASYRTHLIRGHCLMCNKVWIGSNKRFTQFDCVSIMMLIVPPTQPYWCLHGQRNYIVHVMEDISYKLIKQLESNLKRMLKLIRFFKN